MSFGKLKSVSLKMSKKEKKKQLNFFFFLEIAAFSVLHLFLNIFVGIMENDFIPMHGAESLDSHN